MEHNRLTGTIPTECSAMVELEEFSIHRNDLTGTMPEGLCPGQNVFMTALKADCQEIMCDCCTDCHEDPPSSTIETPPPFPINVDDSDGEGVSSNPPPPIEGSLPADPSGCKTKIKTNKDCYVRGDEEEIIISYTICDVKVSDWMAVYESKGNVSNTVALFATRVCQEDQSPCGNFDEGDADASNTDSPVRRRGNWTLTADEPRFGSSEEFRIYLNRGADSVVAGNFFQITKTCS
jgi:hypothetical protein